MELIAAGFGLANMVLLARRSVWNFACGMAMVSILAVLFWQSRLYAVAALQLFFLAAQLIGWRAWLRAAGAGDAVAVEHLARQRWPLVTAAGTTLSILLAVLLAQTDAAAPISDGSVAGWSLVAQGLTNARVVESWPLWAAINVFSVVLYAGQGLWVTAGLYGLFLAIALWSWRDWHRTAQR